MSAAPKTTTGESARPAKTCLFCGQAGKMSKEHLWPRWAQAAIAPSHRGMKTRNALYDGPPGEPFRDFRAPAFEATLRNVCAECNSGWMSAIETDAKPFALPLMLGRSIALATEAQRKLALWAYLKCSLFQNVDRNATLKGAWATAYPVFYESQAAGTLPAIVSVFVARHVGGFVGQYQHRLLGAPSRPAAFIQTFTAGELSLQVIRSYLGYRVLEVERDPRVAGRDHRIWPVTGMFTWSPGEPLNDEELAIYTGPRVVGTSGTGLILPP